MNNFVTGSKAVAKKWKRIINITYKYFAASTHS